MSALSTKLDLTKGNAMATVSVTIKGGLVFPVEFDGEFYRVTCSGCLEYFACYLEADLVECMDNHNC